MGIELEYSYDRPSAVQTIGGATTLRLATSGGATADGVSTHPYFLSSFVEHPRVVADALLMVARVARTRYYVPPGTVAAILRAADPVVTATAQGVRFESFSACCGVYARFDVDADALDAQRLTPGVTNVDVNPPLRQALTALRPGEPLRLDVGSDSLTVTTLEQSVIEEKVALPNRWLKGLAETQVIGAGMSLRYSLNKVDTTRFLRSLPKSSSTKTVLWATQAVRGLRLASHPALGAVCVAGPERLRALEPLLRHAIGLRAYGPEVDRESLPAASSWVLEVPGGRVTVALSPDKSRGFSGEGALLALLAGSSVADDADLISALLAFDPQIDIDRLANESALTVTRVRSALAALASSGQVGFDVSVGKYFHRPLPVHPGALTSLHPRLLDAHQLVDAGAVSSAGGETYQVVSGDIGYRVQMQEGVTDATCTCPWYAKHRGSRGPCKHVLAAYILRTGGD